VKPKKAKLLFGQSNMVILCISSEFNFARAFCYFLASQKVNVFFLDKKEQKNQDLQEKQ